MTTSDDIRYFCFETYVQPAMKAGDAEFSVSVKEVHEALGMKQAHPHIISAVKADVFSEDHNLRMTGYDGPAESSTTILHFEFLEPTVPVKMLERVSKVFIANFGYQNNIWQSCLKGANIATMNDVDTQPFWDAGDRDGFVEYAINNKRATSGKPIGRSTASRWYNLMTIISESAGDIWLHRAKDDLWWTETLNEPHSINLEIDPDPNPGFPEYYVCRKPCKPWSNTDRNGRKLLWQSLHPKARFFLHTEATLQQLRGENPSYAKALINGEDLSKWHERDDWKQILKDAKKGVVGQSSAKELTFASMIWNAKSAADQSGKTRKSVNKYKEVRFKDTASFEAFLSAKYEEQQGLCAISNIALQFQGPDADKQMVCSLDRIDSDGHYEADNLQIVCHFINMWKSDRDNDEFIRHLELIKATP